MGVALEQFAVAGGQVPIEAQLGLGNPFTEFDQEVDDDENHNCSGQDADTSSCNQTSSIPAM